MNDDKSARKPQIVMDFLLKVFVFVFLGIFSEFIQCVNFEEDHCCCSSHKNQHASLLLQAEGSEILIRLCKYTRRK